jgi:hypothetical protein
VRAEVAGTKTKLGRANVGRATWGISAGAFF